MTINKLTYSEFTTKILTSIRLHRDIMTDPYNKYLNANPVEWLMEDSDPCVSYLMRRDFYGNAKEQHYMKALESPEVQSLIARNGTVLGHTGNFDIFYTGSMWCFAEAVERGMEIRTPFVRNTAEFLLDAAQTPSGGFSLNWKPHVAVACRTGDMLKALLRSGLLDESVHKGIGWIVAHQRHDGGWLHCPVSGICDQMRLLFLNKPGNGINRESDTSVKSCFYATASCAMALLEYRDRTDSAMYHPQIMAAAEFFLRRSLYKNRNSEPIHPRKSWNRDFRMIGYPVMSQYDILYGLLIIARAGKISDGRTGDAFNIVISKQNQDGTWNLENHGTGMMEGNRKDRGLFLKNKWITLQVLRLLRYITELPLRQ